MKPKDVLLRDGKITAITRGRISRANHEYLASLVAKGQKIDGYSPVESKNKAGETVVKNEDAQQSGKILLEGFMRMREDEHEAYHFVDGKAVVVSMRTICANCGYSYTGHICDEPKLWLDWNTKVPVYFRSRTTPLPAKKW